MEKKDDKKRDNRVIAALLLKKEFIMNRGYTYFSVYFEDDFDLQEFCSLLDLSVEDCVFALDKKRLNIGKNYEYNVDFNVMVRKSLGILIDKVSELKYLKKKYSLQYYLERVPTLTVDGVNPILSFDRDILEFLYLTGTEDDLDYYIY